MSSFRGGSLLVASLFVAIGEVPAPAQSFSPDANPNLPYGSPLNGNPSQDQQQNNTSTSNSRTASSYSVPAPISQRFEPAIITESPTDSRESDVSRQLLPIPYTYADQQRQRASREAKPGEFEKYVEQVLGRPLPRFGSDLLLPESRDFAAPSTATVPPDYILNPGDVIAISLTGSMEGSVDREIDRDGNIFLPKVGTVHVAGVRYSDLKDRISAAIGRQFRGYDVSVAIKKLRGIRVYVTGFANSPGAFTVSSLSTIANAVLQAGGPSSGGSFRSVKLYRNGHEVTDFDLYELLRGGNRVHDAVLQNEDVLFIPPAGPQVAVVGSVNGEAIYEAKPGETLEDVLRFAGGPNSLGDPSRVILYRTSDPSITGPQQFSRLAAGNIEIGPGDILQVLSKGSLVQPVDRQSVLVRIEGEVQRPGNYYVAPNTPLSQVMAMAGGLTPRAFPFGTKLQRISVRAQQRESFNEAIEQLETSLAAAPLTSDSSVSAADRQNQLAAARATLDRLKRAEPDGRIVLDMSPYANALPNDILLENNDQIMVPPKASTVGVFGAVYRPASFLLDSDRRLRVQDYIYKAGGTMRSADVNSVFVVRANGEVLSKKRGALKAYVLPGDVVFVPVRTQANTFWAKLKDITTMLFQAGLSAATVAAVTK